ncbi:hypothetical protein [Parasitella parasitica]|uniref:Uncharacterized protein n=1 Tax=Parasitella parasitica TaxID=35722 RepID=A0A0B7NT43_9FUNG|nr:hypothetical protein [Parasitella parasitica]
MHTANEVNLKQWDKKFKPQFDCAAIKDGNSMRVKYASPSSKKGKRGADEPHWIKTSYYAKNDTKLSEPRSSGKPDGAQPKGNKHSTLKEKRSNKRKSSGKARRQSSKRLGTKYSSGRNPSGTKHSKSSSAEPTDVKHSGEHTHSDSN